MMWGVFGAAVIAAMLGAAAHARAQNPQGQSTQAKGAPVASAGGGAKQASGEQDDKGELSLRSVKLITGFALTTIPSEVTQPDGKVMKVDKSDLTKVLVPLEDARRIIKVARLSAHAQMCDLPELQGENYLAMMREEQAKKTWTKEQLLFINRLHLFTVMWLTGNVQFTEKEDGKQEAKVLSDPNKNKKRACSNEEKEKVKAGIEAYVKSAQKG